MKLIQGFLLATLLLADASAWAQKLTPGLWESTSTMKHQGAEADERMAKMQSQLANMPPAQRKMMEDMMAKRGGSAGGGNAMDMMAGKPTTTRMCITAEQAARDFAPAHDGRCKTDSTERSGKTVRVKFSCTGEAASSGESEYTLISDKAFTGHVTVNTVRNGKPARMDINSAGKWLADDCGTVKPFSEMVPKRATAVPGTKP
jgi:Protein of unknown function (DUF3617)